MKLLVGTNLAYSLGFLRVLGPPAFFLLFSNQLSWMQMAKSEIKRKKNQPNNQKGKLLQKSPPKKQHHPRVEESWLFQLYIALKKNTHIFMQSSNTSWLISLRCSPWKAPNPAVS